MNTIARLHSAAIKIRSVFTAALAAVFLFGATVTVSGCVKNADGSITLNTATAQKLITAAAYAGTKIEALPAVSAHLTSDDRAKYDAAIAKIESMTSLVNTNTSGSLTLALGTNWASDLLNDLQTLIDVATPIVAQYAPSVTTYLTTVSDLIPLIEAFLPVSDPRHVDPVVPTNGGAVLSVRANSVRLGVVNQDDVLSKIYAGP